MIAITCTPRRLAQTACMVAFLSAPFAPLIGGHEPDSHDNYRNGRGTRARQMVLYEGPLAHDTDWRITQGTNNNQSFRAFGGTCSMIPANVRNSPGSATERVTFEAEHEGLGLWRMQWTDIVSGRASADSGAQYRYTYMQRWTFYGPSTDGRPPAPNRAAPNDSSPGFLRPVPDNVNADAVELHDIFILQEETTGRLVANSHILWTLRLRTTPSEQPPAAFPAVVHDRYIVNTQQQLAGQLGCDPL